MAPIEGISPVARRVVAGRTSCEPHLRGEAVKGRVVLVLSLAIVAFVWLAASSAARTRATGGERATPDLRYVGKVVRQYTAIPRFTLKAQSFNAKKLKGKTIFTIPVSSSVPYDAIIDKAQARVAKRYGIHYIDYPNQGQVSQWVQGFGQAIARKPDLILLLGASPYVLTTQLRQARSAHIPVLSTHAVDPTMPKPAVQPPTVHQLFTKAARLEADWVIHDTKGKANVVVVTSNDFLPSRYIVKAIQDEFTKRCGSTCKTKVVDVPVPDWSTKMQSASQSALISDPGVNYVIAIYDGMCQFVVPAITAAHRQGQVHIATYNGTPFVLKDIHDGDIVRMDLSENLEWLGWADMDAAMRMLAGLKPPADEQTALRMFTKANVGAAGTPPVVNRGLGNAYVGGYNRLWSGK
jgi:ribose transport system substrate-binding protein